MSNAKLLLEIPGHVKKPKYRLGHKHMYEAFFAEL